jgi:diguanylate cyclase (GGDEF)-like protein
MLSWPGRWSLVLRFGLVSALLAGSLAVALTGWLSGSIRTSNQAHAKDTASYSMALTLGVIGVKATQRTPMTLVQYQQVTELLRAMVGTKKFAGATAWSTPTSVVYAAETGRTGTQERSRIQVAVALSGRLTSAVVKAPQLAVPDRTERAALRDGPLLEVFVPVVLGGRVVAAVEFYQRWQPIQQAIDRQIREMLLLVTAGLLLLWLLLLRFVMTADRKLRVQVAANLEMASHDPLTGLPNRKVVTERTTRALRAAGVTGCHTGLLLLDLDRFKEVNDTLGHRRGDLLLQQVGPRLHAVLRGGDSVARIGGDEFVVLLTEVPHQEMAVNVARRIVEVLSAPFLLDTVTVEVGVSIGVALSPQHGTDFDSLLQHADTAMYAAKASRAGFAVYAPGSGHANADKLAMLGQLRVAVQDPSELVVFYQPKADLVTGEVLGVEALVRWQHPADGLVAPSEFIPLAEQSGLIRPLTVRVLEEALNQIRLWNQQGLRLKVAVNISTRCLDSDLPDLVGRLLKDNRVPADQLQLEITESTIMADPDRAIEVLARLKILGVDLSLDDFGTGYSSMAYLKQLPVDELKIDQSLITDMTPGSTDTAIVRSCIELARTLDMKVVAEGVETPSVWNQLTELGCDFAQGYFLAKPMPADVAYSWILERSQRGDVSSAQYRTTVDADDLSGDPRGVVGGQEGNHRRNVLGGAEPRAAGDS